MGAASSSPNAGGAPSTGAAGGSAAAAGGSPSGGGPGTEAQTSGEKTGALDEELAGSLEEFDGMLLKEQKMQTERREELGDASRTGGGSAAGSGGSGGSPGSAPQSGAGSSANSTGQGGGDSSGGTPAAGGSGGGSGAPVPSDVGDGNDDDIVARQLREAAMKEEDPALREKLWQEYRDYKKGVRPKSSGKSDSDGDSR